MNLPIVNNDGAVSYNPEAIHAPTCATWVQTHTGRAVDLENPDPATIHAHDIAVALARVARFGGHTIDHWTVAQHSVLVQEIVLDQAIAFIGPREMSDLDLNALRLAALLHDAHEAYMGDITSPVASLPGLQAPLRQLKNRLQRAVHMRFGLPETLPHQWRDLIRHADMVALATEKRDQMVAEPMPWANLPDPYGRVLDLGYRYWLGAQFQPFLDVLSRRARA